MTNKETIERNIELTFDFVNYLIENKEEMNKLPYNFELVFVENDFSKADSKQAPTDGPNLQNKYVRVKNSFDITF
jgi:hypothetical protein